MIKQPRAHQAEAVAAATSTLNNGGSALVVMATATGKTLVGAWVSARLHSRRTLVMVPTLELVSQTLAEWQTSGSLPDDTNHVVVCSDRQIGRALDQVDVHVTTDPDELTSLLDTPQPTLTIGTYQSSQVLAEASARTRPFDLAVCDEAHHLAGDPRKSFAAIVRGEIAAERRLYLTATPRLWNSRGETTTSMDDPDTFGPQVYDLRLGAAVDADLTADYQVVVAAADPQVVNDTLQHLDLNENVDERTVAAAVATLITMQKRNIRRMVTFHSRIGRARQFSSALLAAWQVMPHHLRPEGPGQTHWVSSTSPKTARREALQALGSNDRSQFVVVANARLLSEGVDVPDLDAVAIVDPKSSDVDVAQAVGRALRQRPGKTATVLVPAVAEHDQLQTVLDQHGLEAAGSVLRALRAHDDNLSSRLDEARRALGNSRADYRRQLRQLYRHRILLDLPPQATAEVAQAIHVAVLRDATSDWEEAYGHLERWVDNNGTADVPQSTTTSTRDGDPFALGVWVSTQRGRQKRGTLPDEQQAALECLPGWTWDAVRSRVEHRINALADWLNSRPAVDTPPSDIIHRQENIGQVCNWLRSSFADGTLDDDTAAYAEQTIDGWVWNQREADWRHHLHQLVAYQQQTGSACPSSGQQAEDGFDIGRWTNKQRSKLKKGKLSPEQEASLRAVPGWVDDVREHAWQQQYEALQQWVTEHGHACPAQSDGASGRWVAKQRAKWRRGTLAEHHAELLEQLDGWQWEPGRQRSTWEESLQLLRQYVDVHGTARVPYSHETDEGFQLGIWVQNQRTQFNSGDLNASQQQQLEQLQGWTWDPQADRWWRRFSQLEQYANQHSQTVHPSTRLDDGYQLGMWLHRQLERAADGRLDPEQIEALQPYSLTPAEELHDAA